jgi:hypothetical protein
MTVHSPADDERHRRRRLREGSPTEADAPPPGRSRGPKPIAGQTDIWQQLDEIAAERRDRGEPPAA